MYPTAFDIVRADSLEAAAALLAEHGPTAEVLAGGQSLIPLLKSRMAAPEVIVDVSHIDPGPITAEEGVLQLPALATHHMVLTDPTVEAHFDVLTDAIPEIADPQIRNVGTVGGSLAEADPAGDWGPLVLATGGEITAVGPETIRTIPAEEFFHGPFTTALEPAELVGRISLPIPPDRSGGAYLKVERRQGSYGIVGVAVQLSLADDGQVASIAAACADDVTAYVDLTEAADRLIGHHLDAERLDAVADTVHETVDPVGDERGSEAYKRNLARSLFRRAVRIAHLRATGETVEADPLADPVAEVR